MPQSRKRSGHHEYRNSSAINSKQRVKGRTIMSLLFGVFGLLIAMFASFDNKIIWVIALVSGAALGYYVGKKMEKQAVK